MNTNTNKPSPCGSKAVVSIDIGTSSSGFAFVHEKNSNRVHVNTSNGIKIPTILLLKLPNLEFVAFGPEAKQLFEDATPAQRRDYLYFANFKMALYKHFTKITAINNQIVRVDAIIVFYHCISYLVSQALQALNSGSGSGKWTINNVNWILTIPSIWDADAKEIMKQAALRASIPEAHLLIESEAAAIYCRDMLVKSKEEKEEKTFLVIDLGGGTADFTVHRTVSAKHTNVIEIVAPSGGAWGGARVNEQFIQMLNRLFGESVMTQFNMESPHAYLELEQSFEQLKVRTHVGTQTSPCYVRLPNELIQLIPKLTKTQGEIELEWFVHEQQQAETQSILTVIDDYVETKEGKEKKEVSSSSSNDGSGNQALDDDDDFDFSDGEEADQVARLLAEHKTNIWFCQGKLKFPWSTMLNFFSDVLKGIEQHTQDLLQAHPSIDTTFLVGGFAQSTIVRNFLQDHVFKVKQNNQEKNLQSLHFPQEPQQAVLFGAVLYGNRPRQIQSRIAAHNYGIKSAIAITKQNRELYKKLFPNVPRRLELRSGKIKKFIESVYLPLCNKGEALPIALPEDLKNEGFDERIWKVMNSTPDNPAQKSMTIHFYESLTTPERQWMSPESIAKKEFRLVGSAHIPLPRPGTERKLKLWFHFADSCIHIRVVDSVTNSVESTICQLKSV